MNSSALPQESGSSQAPRKPVRRGRWAYIESGRWQLIGTDLTLELDRQHGWCLFGKYDGIYPGGMEFGWSMKDAMRDAETWTCSGRGYRLYTRKVADA